MFRFVLVVSFFLLTQSQEEKEHEVFERGIEMDKNRDMEEEVLIATAGEMGANQNHTSVQINISKHLGRLYNGTWGTYIGVKLTDELISDLAQPGFHIIFRYKNTNISIVKRASY